MSERRCACGCPRTPGAGRDYFDARCRQRAYRNRLKARAEALGVAPAVSLKTLNALDSTTPHNGDAEKPSKQPLNGKARGFKPPFQRSLRNLVARGVPEVLAREALIESLSPREREIALEQRTTTTRETHA